MKIERFLDWIQDNLLNYPDIDFATVKMFTDRFSSCLSPLEREKHRLRLQMIDNMTSTQITLDRIVQREKTNILGKELTKLKEKVV